MNIAQQCATYLFGPLTPYLKPYRWRIVWAAFCSICNQVLDISQDILIGMMLDVALLAPNPMALWFGFTAIEAQLMFLAATTI